MLSSFKNITLLFELKIISLIFKRKANKVKAEWKGEPMKMVFGKINPRS